MKFIKITLAIFLAVFSLSVTALTLNVPNGFLTEYKQEWKNLETQITSTKDSTIILNWWGYGGYTTYLDTFLEAVFVARLQGKQVIFNLIGPSYSAHAIAVCYGTEVRNLNRNFIMFHLIEDQWGVDTSFYGIQEINKYIAPCLKSGLVTQKEVTMLKFDYEVYVFPGYSHTTTYYLLDRRNI